MRFHGDKHVILQTVNRAARKNQSKKTNKTKYTNKNKTHRVGPTLDLEHVYQFPCGSRTAVVYSTNIRAS